MAGRDLGEVHIGIETNAFQIGNGRWFERIVEILGHDIGVGRGAGACQIRASDSTAAGDIPDPINERGSDAVLADAGANFFGLHRIEDVIEVCEEGAESESHGVTVAFSLRGESRKTIRAEFRRFEKDSARKDRESTETVPCVGHPGEGDHC